MSKDISMREHLAKIASKGGKTTGKSKVRGDAGHYQRLSKLAAKARRKK